MTRTQRRNHLIAWLIISGGTLSLLISALVVRARTHTQLANPSRFVNTAPTTQEDRP